MPFVFNPCIIVVFILFDNLPAFFLSFLILWLCLSLMEFLSPAVAKNLNNVLKPFWFSWFIFAFNPCIILFLFSFILSDNLPAFCRKNKPSLRFIIFLKFWSLQKLNSFNILSNTWEIRRKIAYDICLLFTSILSFEPNILLIPDSIIESWEVFISLDIVLYLSKFLKITFLNVLIAVIIGLEALGRVESNTPVTILFLNSLLILLAISSIEDVNNIVQFADWR